MKPTIFIPIVKIGLHSFAHYEAKLRIDGHVSGIEYAMNVSS
jgi:hypothetical protein